MMMLLCGGPRMVILLSDSLPLPPIELRPRPWQLDKCTARSYVDSLS